MLRWNDKYGIKFMRLSSEMFPFASHEEYGYKLAPFVSKELAEAGKVAAELGHRLTTHPGQVIFAIQVPSNRADNGDSIPNWDRRGNKSSIMPSEIWITMLSF